MISYKKALNLVLFNSKVLKTECLFVEDSINRQLAEDIYSDIDMPPFNKSAMDGYAVDSGNVKKIPHVLEAAEEIQAGMPPKRKICGKTCAKIMTGAQMPKGTDSVVMIEDTAEINDRYIELRKKPKRHQNICFKGEDMRKGAKILKRGKLLNAADIAILASTGVVKVNVYKQPSLAILATGNEIIPADKFPSPCQIRNSNTPMLTALFLSQRIRANNLGIAKDNIKDLKRKIKQGLKNNILIITGGVSMGDYDLVPKVLAEIGVETVFHKVAVKPGKPVFFGRYRDTIIFGCPGNPVSVLTTFHIFILPAIKRMQGILEDNLRIRKAIAGTDFCFKGNRLTFLPVKTIPVGSYLELFPINWLGPANIEAVSNADGFIVLDKSLKKGDTADYILL